MLYIVSTPIGNLEDITLRAIDMLKKADLIAAEDTRHFQKLAIRYQIKTPTTSYHDHNKVQKTPFLIEKLKAGKLVVLVSDAGTPGISDPGFYLIREAIRNNIPVTVIPGASAIISALVLSGMPTDKFIFEGFLSHKHVARQKRLAQLKEEKRTMIFYESPYRIPAFLEDVLEILGDRPIVCVRELTKKFEEVFRGSTADALQHFQRNKPRGEFVVVI
ncbi:MAG: 16S rRNA (cytidine(1402)-2'-O)-methyltransferase [Candidatus Omnitrophica bacterium]|nr:16S rRNA (cytidine(1402)-2'-O)-methyltransferase [Candidatus Omnitrophota bacterium]